MAKRKIEINQHSREKRLERIAKCEQCKGNPSTKKCNLQGLIFDMCEDCSEIVGDYRKEGTPITIKSKVAIPANFRDPDFRKEITTEEIPGEGTNFNQLQID